MITTNAPPAPPPTLWRRRRTLLLLVLWAVSTLGALALDFSTRRRANRVEDAAAAFAEETQAHYLALAGMANTLSSLRRVRDRGASPSPTDEGMDLPADGLWHAQTFGDGRYTIRVSDEGGRLPINQISEALLTRVIANLLPPPAQSVDVATVVDSILDWRDPDSTERPHGAERSFYEANRDSPCHLAKNSFFDSPEELLLVRGVTPALFLGSGGKPGLKDLVSAYNPRALNLRTMSPALLQILLGVDTAAPRNSTGQWTDHPEDALGRLTKVLRDLDPELASRLRVDGSPGIVFVEVRADNQKPRTQSAIAALVDLSQGDVDSVRVLRWFDSVGQ